MSYVIVTGRKTVSGGTFPSYDAAFRQALALFGGETSRWLTLNLRIEENR